MNKKKLLYWVGGGGTLILLWLWFRNRPETKIAANWQGPQYLTYNQPQFHGQGVGGGASVEGDYKGSRGGDGCGCNPALSEAMSNTADMANRFSDQIQNQLQDYIKALDDFVN